MNGLDADVQAVLSPKEYLEFVMAPAFQEDVQPGEVHSKEWAGVDARAHLSREETTKALAKLDYKADPRAAVPYFTNGLGLEKFYEKWVEPSAALPNKVAPWRLFPDAPART